MRLSARSSQEVIYKAAMNSNTPFDPIESASTEVDRQAKPGSMLTLFLIVGLVFLSLLSAVLLVENQQLKTQQKLSVINQTQLTPTIATFVPSPTTRPTESAVRAEGSGSLRAYEIRVGGTKQGESLQVAVYKALYGSNPINWPKDTRPVLYYQYSQYPSKIYEKSFEEKKAVTFYVLFDQVLVANQNYGDDQFFVTVIREVPKLQPYLANGDYCEQDSDCSIRYNWCEKGGWNDYQAYIEDIGCTAGFNEGQLDTTAENLGCDTSYYPGVIAQYSGTRCINNNCAALDPSFSCPTSDYTWYEDGMKF